MHTRNITIGRQTLSIETGKLAKQADGAVVVRSGDTMVLVTACARGEPARRHRLPAADGRLPRIHLRVGPHPRRLLQARRQAGREGSAHQPPDRSADPAAVPGRLALRDADHRARALGRHRERHRRAGDHRRLGGARALRDPVHRRRSPASASAWSTASSSINPTFEQRKQQHARSHRRRQQGRHRDGRSRREGSHRRGDRRGARARRTPRSSRSSPASTTLRAEARQEEARRSRSKEIDHDFYREVEEKVYVPLTEAMRIQDKLENYGTRRPGARRICVASHPRGRGRAQASTPRRSSRSSRRRCCATRCSSAACGSTAASSTRSARSGSRSACCRATHGSAVFTRGETQALVTATLGTADDEQKIETRRRRDVEALHAPLQLPAVLGRRSRQFLRGPGRREIGHGALAERALDADDARPKRSSPTPSASSPTSSSRTARRRWRRSAAARWR